MHPYDDVSLIGYGHIYIYEQSKRQKNKSQQSKVISFFTTTHTKFIVICVRSDK